MLTRQCKKTSNTHWKNIRGRVILMPTPRQLEQLRNGKWSEDEGGGGNSSLEKVH
jgi:hypothetical protein